MDRNRSATSLSSESRVHTLKTARHLLRQLAESTLTQHPLHNEAPRFLAEPEGPQIRIVCISDTHSQRPDTIPLGDILIHAGDLTDNGSFEEMQAGLDWLAAQPHQHKIFVAGNHDVLLDQAFLARYPERRYGNANTAHDLVWPDNVVYLKNSSVVLEMSNHTTTVSSNQKSASSHRKVRIYGSPYTPEYVPSAFQYARTNTTFWHHKIPSETDIVVTHGPACT